MSGWVNRLSGTKNGLQAVIFSLICKIGHKFLGTNLACWHHRLAFRVFILCPAERVDGVNGLSGTQNSLQAVICSLICKIGKKFLGPILAWWYCCIAYRVFILCPAGQGDGVNGLSGTQKSLQAVICSLICKIGKKFLGPILAWWHCRIAYRVFILCPAGRGDGINALSGAQNTLQPCNSADRE